MSKIIVRRQEYANNGTHANEIEAVVKDNLIVNTLSSAMDVVPSVGLLKSVRDEFDVLGAVEYKEGNGTIPNGEWLTLATHNLTKGIYIVVGDIWFSGNANGIRILMLDVTDTVANSKTNSVLGTGSSDLSKTRIIQINNEGTLYLKGYQTSGVDLNSSGRISVVRLR